MDKFQATFEVLYLVSACDGEVSDEEIDVINGYIEANLGQSDYDTQALARSLGILSEEDMGIELGAAAGYLNDVCSPMEKLNILDYAVTVVMADDDPTLVERQVIDALGEIWNIDIEKFLESR